MIISAQLLSEFEKYQNLRLKNVYMDAADNQYSM
jgi:hypothetical protein